MTERAAPERRMRLFEHPRAWSPEILQAAAGEIGIATGEALQALFQEATRRSLNEETLARTWRDGARAETAMHRRRQ